MQPHDELAELLSGLLDGPCDPMRGQALCRLLRDHPELRQPYLDHLQLHALLQWRGGAVVPAETNPAPRAVPIRSRWRLVRRLLVAALLCLAVGVGLCLVIWPPRTQAASDVVERLVDWDLELVRASSVAERQEIYHSRADRLKDLLTKAALPPEDRELARSLFETGSWLVGNEDPTAEAERFSDLADEFLTRLDSAVAANDAGRVAKLADSYGRLAEAGVSRSLQRAAASSSDPQRKRRLDRVASRHAHRGRKLEEMLERNPERARPAIHRALKKGHARKGHSAPKSPE